jgi:hypothetical protein
MQINNNLFGNILPCPSLPCRTPTVSLVGLLDLIDALWPEIKGLPSLASLWAEELRRDLLEVVKSDG